MSEEEWEEWDPYFYSEPHDPDFEIDWEGFGRAKVGTGSNDEAIPTRL